MVKSDKRKVVLKIGSSTLTQGSARISRGKIEDIAAQFYALKEEIDFILVSSGAIAAARQFTALNKTESLQEKQALAAIGQVHLMRIYQEVFRDYGLNMAQCLFTHYDFNNNTSADNIKNTIGALLDYHYVPIINENDTVSTEEIKFGDNDKLAAMTAVLLKADLLILATDTNGVYDKDPKNHPDASLLSIITNPAAILSTIESSTSMLGSGGMKSKIISATIAAEAGIESWILNGGEENFINRALQNTLPFTKIVVSKEAH